MPPTYPAFFIGGPPHSGKSIFSYRLSQLLRHLRVPHYLLRAAPDGEGDWTRESEQALARALRDKRSYETRFAERVARVLASRPQPFLVDVGGKITREQELIATHCTHAILVSNNRKDLQAWHDFARCMGLQVVGHFHSRLDATDTRLGTGDPFEAILNLREKQPVEAETVLAEFAQRLAEIIGLSVEEMRDVHFNTLPDPSARILDVERFASRWEPSMLPRFLEEEVLPYCEGDTLAIYGRAPNWVYAAVAAVAPSLAWQFDATLGWLPTLQLSIGHDHAHNPIEWTHAVEDGWQWLRARPKPPFIARNEMNTITLPALEPLSLVLEGKMPHWFYIGAARAYASHVPRLAIFQAQRSGLVVEISGQQPGCVHTLRHPFAQV
nr:hypothetical protein [Ardenticatena sp.]